MKVKFAKIISIITVVPIISFITITGIYLYKSSIFNNKLSWYISSLIFITLIPILAYGLKNIFPSYKDKGRIGERQLAFVMAVIGYTLGVIVAKLFNAPRGVLTIFLTYFISGILLTITNKVLKIKASGHACGTTSSLILFLCFFGIRFWYMVLLLPIVYWARLTQKRHTFIELIIGTLIGVFSGVIA